MLGPAIVALFLKGKPWKENETWESITDGIELVINAKTKGTKKYHKKSKVIGNIVYADHLSQQHVQSLKYYL
jgi:hypothetical protein